MKFEKVLCFVLITMIVFSFGFAIGVSYGKENQIQAIDLVNNQITTTENLEGKSVLQRQNVDSSIPESWSDENVVYGVGMQFHSSVIIYHNVLYAAVTGFNPTLVQSVLKIFESIDGGKTWRYAHEFGYISSSLNDQIGLISLTIDRNGGWMYVAYEQDDDIWLWRVFAEENALILVDGDEDIDNDPTIAIGYGPDNNHHVYISYSRKVSLDNQDICIARSTNYGLTFSTWREKGLFTAPFFPDFNVYAHPEITTDRNGNVYVTYAFGADSYSLEDICIEWGPGASNAEDFEHFLKPFDGSPSYPVDNPSIALSQDSSHATRIVIAFQRATTPTNSDIISVYCNGEEWSMAAISMEPEYEFLPKVSVAGAGYVTEVMGDFFVAYRTGDDFDAFSPWTDSSWKIERAPYNDLSSWSSYRNYTGEKAIYWSRQEAFGITTRYTDGAWVPVLTYIGSVYTAYCATAVPADPLPPPSHFSPDNNSILNLPNPTFIWLPVTGASAYQINIVNITSTPSKFDIVDIKEPISAVDVSPVSVYAETTDYGIIYDLGDSDGAKYKWRVRANDSYGDWGEWSEYWYFSIDTLGPDPPELLSPADHSEVYDTIIDFQWRGVSDAMSYQLEIVDNYQTGNQVYFMRTNTTRVIAVTSLSEGTYYWRVKCFDFFGNPGSNSQYWRFDLNMTLPDRVTLVSPDIGSTLEYPTPYLNWNPLGTAISYQVQVSNTSDFSIVLQEANTTNSDFVVSLLTNGTYYWRVRARNIEGIMGSWSAVWSFTIETTITEIPSPGFEIVLSIIPLLILGSIVVLRRRRIEHRA